jgi:hypothetical protein
MGSSGFFISNSRQLFQYLHIAYAKNILKAGICDHNKGGSPFTSIRARHHPLFPQNGEQIRSECGNNFAKNIT